MAADQRKKRLNAANLVSCTSREQFRVKRKKMELPQHGLSMRPNISLAWDDRKKSVVSKREQIGISRRDLIPFIEPGPDSHDILADVFSVPQEIFELENLSEVLSYEVWQSHLSEKERIFLSQLLPKEAEPDAVVRELLAGDNMHFGNPFLKWGTSVCSWELHPDCVLHEEQSFKAGKKAYYSDLQKYHNDMIKNLQMWKEKWASCKNPEVDIVQNIWRSGDHAEKNVPPSDTRFYDTEENLVATPESCSWANSEKAYSSDNQNLGNLREESRRRKSNKISDISSTGLKGIGVSKKGGNVHKRNIQRDDGAKYMSYIKVSKKQHECVKSSMKHACNSIHPRFLNNVLGSIDALNVQPFERFEEEERKKLHEYWLKLATRDISEGFANWKKRQLMRQQLTWSLGAEIEQKVEQQETAQDEGKELSADKITEVSNDSAQEILPSITIEDCVERDKSEDSLQAQMANEEAVHEMSTEKEDKKELKSDHIFEEQTHDNIQTTEDEDVSDGVFIQDNNHQQIASLSNSPPSTMITLPSLGFLQGQHQHQFSSLNSNSHTNAMEMESHCNSTNVKAYENLPVVSKYPGNLNNVDIPLCEGDQLRTASDVWAAGDIHGSYYRSSATNAGYASNQELAIGDQQFIQEQPVGMLGLEIDTQDKGAGKVMVHRQSEDLSFFSPYTNQDRSELLQSLFKGQSSLSYHNHHQKHSGLEFQPGNNVTMEAGQFSGRLREQVHPSLPLDIEQESMYSGGRYGMPINDWAAVNTVRMPAVPQPYLNNSGELSHSNWYTGETRERWSTLGNRSSSLGSGNNSDQTLFSVLSECSQLQPGSGYGSISSTEQRVIQAGNYSAIGGGLPPSSNFLQQSPNPLQYLSGHEATGIKRNNIGWMGLPQQNTGLQESIGKPFLRSWNQ